MIKEVIIVEGRDDEAAVKKAIDAEIIITHGYGINKRTLDLIEKAYESNGIIIFTDPDFAGEQIRKRLSEKFPNSKHAHLSRDEARKDSDIGIENATSKSILAALQKSRISTVEKRMEFTQEDLIKTGLAGDSQSSKKRNDVGQALGIGYSNSKTFLNRLNHYGITRKEFEEALHE